MTSPTYEKLSKVCGTMAPRFKHILSLIPENKPISSVLLFEKNKEELLNTYKNEKYAKTTISQALKCARDLNIIKRCDDTSTPEWFESLKTVSFWQLQLRGSKAKNTLKNNVSTKTQYLYHLWNFNKWLVKDTFTINTLQGTLDGTFVQKAEEKYFENIEELFTILEQPFADQKNITRIIKQYLLDEIHTNKKASYLVIIKSAIVSYFEKNEQPIQVLFNPKSVYSTETEYEQSMSISDLMEFLTTGKPSVTEKALFLCKFHRGLDVSTLVDRFNYEAWEQIVQWFGSENHNSWDLEKCPVPVSLIRIKTDYKHVGFLERDAIEQLQKYLDFRKIKTGQNMKSEEPLFLNKFKRPISTAWVFASFSRIVQRAGIQKFVEVNGRKQYKMDSHELRDLLKSTLIDSGCRIDVADHVIGHKPKDSYEKQSILYPETLRKEYAKASARLNIFTKFTSVVNGTDDSDELKLELVDMKNKASELIEQQREHAVTRYQDEFFAQNQQKHMNEQDDKMSNMLKEMKSLRSELSALKGKPEKLEFCCIGCSVIHDKESCPACDSKLKRIYEDKVQN